MDWTDFKEEFEYSGEDIHIHPFIVEWKENVDVFDSLHGVIRGEDQELAHDVTFNVTNISISGMPTLYDVRWKSADCFEPCPNTAVFEGHVVVSSPFLAAAAIHFAEV